MGTTIGIVSLKGGVGKTSSVAALGSALANFGKKVLLVDGNLSAPNLGIHFKIIEPERTLHHVLNREIHAKDAIYSVGNVDVIPASIFTNVEVNPLKLKDVMSYAKRKYDYVLYDSSPTLQEETLGVMLASDNLLVVTTPDHPTLSTTMKAVKLAKQRGTNIHGLIINKVHGKKFEISAEHVEESIDVPVLAVVPHDMNVLKALSEFKSSVEHKPNSLASEEYMKLAAALVGQKHKKRRMKNLFGWLHPKKHEINRLILYEGVFRN